MVKLFNIISFVILIWQNRKYSRLGLVNIE
jgi:hypothetical protein